MAVHQDKGVLSPAGARARFTQGGQKAGAIGVIAEISSRRSPQ
jgi:hypothetical protein